MGRPCTCPICHKVIPNSEESIPYKNKHYHPECYQEQKIKDDLYEYICRLFTFKAPGPRIYSQISKYIAKGYTYKGIYQALQYFYEVKHGDIKKANEGIGIVPYVYDEAQHYYAEKQNQQIELAKKIGESIATTNVTKIVKQKPKEKKKLSYDIEDF